MASVGLAAIRPLNLLLLLWWWWSVVAAVDQCPAVCSCLGSHVDCSRRGLTAVPNGLPSWTETLELQGNRLENVSADAFIRLAHLQKLDLSDNRLSSLSRLVLSDLPQLTALSLKKNHLTTVPLGIESVASLRRIDLRSNRIQVVSAIDVARLARIDDVDLGKNRIADWPQATVLAGTCRIRKLDLANNQLDQLRASAFASLPTLRDLRLSRNSISRLHKDSFKGLVSLRSLDLNRNKLKLIEGLTFRGLTSLESLTLTRNGLKTLEDGALWGLDSLKELNLKNNKLSSVANGWLYGAASLLRLDLAYNDIGTIDPSAWSYCSSLQHLNLSSNRLKTLPASSFRKLIDLRELSLISNGLEWIEDDTFNDLVSLEILDLSGNILSASVEDAVRPFSKHLSRLRALSLSANNLRSIPSRSFHRLSALKRLDLGDNQLTTIQIDAFEGLELNELIVNTSSLLCDCKLDWLGAWLKEWRLGSDGEFICGHPEQLQGLSLFDVNPANMTCDNSPKPSITEQPKSISGLTDGNAELSCAATASDSSELSVEWKIQKDGKSRTLYAEPDSLEIETTLDGTTLSSKLTMYDLTREDAADYQCVVRNRFGTAYSRKATLVVNVFPTFLKTPQNVTLEPGRNARLECSALGYPAPVLRWQKDGGDDFPAARERRMHVMPTDDVFFIVNVKPIDAGVYTCRAANDAGEIKAVASIIVLEKPSFRQPLQDKTVQAGATVVLSCVAEGSPAPKVNWYWKDAKIEGNERFSLTAENQMLVIVRVQSSDAGEYACEISSDLGSVRQSAQLTVVGEMDAAMLGNRTVAPTSVSKTTEAESWWPLDSPEMIGVAVIGVVACIVITSLVWVLVIWCRVRARKSKAGGDSLTKGAYAAVAKDELPRVISAPNSRPGYLVTYADGSHSYTSSSLRSRGGRANDLLEDGTFLPYRPSALAADPTSSLDSGVAGVDRRRISYVDSLSSEDWRPTTISSEPSDDVTLTHVDGVVQTSSNFAASTGSTPEPDHRPSRSP